MPIFALAYEHDPDPEMRSYDKPVSPELREKLIIGAAAAVMRIYRYFQERRFHGNVCFWEQHDLPAHHDKGRAQRTMSLRLRQEVQTMLWPDHSALI